MGWEIWLWAGPVPVGHIHDPCEIFGLTPSPQQKVSSPGGEDPDGPKNLIYVIVHGIDIRPPVPIAYKTSTWVQERKLGVRHTSSCRMTRGRTH